MSILYEVNFLLFYCISIFNMIQYNKKDIWSIFMNIFKKIYKKIFGDKRKVEEKAQECWYNNAHEDASSKLGVPMEGVAFSDPEHGNFAATQFISKS